MSRLTKIKDSLNKASTDTAKVMAAHLRTETRASGWPDEIVRSLYVAHKEGKFHVGAHPTYYAEVLNLEYGTPSTNPTAAIRRFNSRQAESEKFLLGRAMSHLGRA